MPPVAVIEKIRAPAEKVFDFIGHVETHPEIADFSQSIKIISERKSGVGMRFHQVYTNGAEHVSEIMAWEPNKKIVWRNFEGDCENARHDHQLLLRGRRPLHPRSPYGRNR